ncbi:hypothetical protein HHL22_10620 [Hymenobacter sp. RP-2-7]|uniref:Outer membrane lipoprotein-sorting protein n=1 Tax=Hymenobacter polaris TaxID=2682546 RepID=A0A7Y0AE44_9BACT|nr:hypothetical protein [Hymenobacter polaris]NML65658.1 hypothetical protein [Hymenobacter polaris]
MTLSKLLTFLLCLSSLTVQAQHAAPQYTLDDMAITVEKFDSLNKDQNRYNQDNRIYTVGKRFTFSYDYRDPTGCRLQLAKADTVSKNGVAWQLVPATQGTDKAVSQLTLSVVPGLMPFLQIFPDYNQTVIQYDFTLADGRVWTNEMTGVIENPKNLWLHPPRTGLFAVLELDPFPYVKQPLHVGASWSWKLAFGDHWADKHWLVWKGKNKNVTQYKVTNKLLLNSKLGALTCYVVASEATSALGSTKLVAYYNEQVGFVKLAYTNIDQSSLTLELQRVE